MWLKITVIFSFRSRWVMEIKLKSLDVVLGSINGIMLAISCWENSKLHQQLTRLINENSAVFLTDSPPWIVEVSVGMVWWWDIFYRCCSSCWWSNDIFNSVGTELYFHENRVPTCVLFRCWYLFSSSWRHQKQKSDTPPTIKIESTQGTKIFLSTCYWTFAACKWRVGRFEW